MVLLQRIYKVKMDKKQIIESLVFPFIMTLFARASSQFKIESSPVQILPTLELTLS